MKIEKLKNLLANLYNKTEYFIHIRNLKQALNHGLEFKKLHRVIKFNQKFWLKPYIDMSTDLRKAAKNDFRKDFFKSMIKKDFLKTFLKIFCFIVCIKTDDIYKDTANNVGTRFDTS